jgi:hypothetical protein
VITSNNRYWFGGKVSTIETPTYRCHVSTAKDGFFKKQSVWFSDVSSGWTNRERTAKLNYADVITKSERLYWHDEITRALDKAGMSGASLRVALETLCASLDEKRIGRGEFVDEALTLMKCWKRWQRGKHK